MHSSKQHSHSHSSHNTSEQSNSSTHAQSTVGANEAIPIWTNVEMKPENDLFAQEFETPVTFQSPPLPKRY